MAPPGQLQPVLGEVRLAVVGAGVLQVRRVDLEGLLQQVPLTHQNGAALERLVEPLVRVEGHRVREVQPGQRCAPALGECGERAVRAVDVQPDAALVADTCKLGQVVDRPQVALATGQATLATKLLRRAERDATEHLPVLEAIRTTVGARPGR
ncbi:MAG: hypothetical protein ABJA81_07145 [Nocardioidaceae bacterium]